MLINNNMNELITNQVKNFIDKYHIKNLKMYIEDKNNVFTQMSQAHLEYEYTYNNASLTVYAVEDADCFNYKNDDEFKDLEYIILIRQKGSCINNDIDIYEEQFEDKTALIIQYNTISSYGQYLGSSSNLYFQLLI